MATEEEILNQLDDKFAKLKDGEKDRTPVDDPPDDDPQDDPDGKPEAKDPPGFKSYEQYVAEGGDPDLYRGKKAYVAEHDRIEANKALKAEIKELKELSRTVASTMSEWQQQQKETIKAQLMAELKEAKETGDVDAALGTQKKIDALESAKPKEAPKVNPVISEFIEKHPILDAGSDQFNKDFFDDVVKFHNKAVAEMTAFPLGDPRSGTDLTDAQVQKCAKRAYEMARELNKELFQSPRNERPGQTRQTTGASQGAKGASYRQKLSNLTINTRNPELNGNAAIEMYDMLYEKDPKAADKYAKNLLGE